MRQWLPFISALFLLFLMGTPAHAKPYKRVLVLSGGGLAPGVGLGIIHGLESKGWKPDVIIAVCGSSISASLYNGFDTTEEALQYAESKAFYQILRTNVRLDERSVFGIKRKLDNAASHMGLLPDIFEDTIIKFPDQLSRILPQEKFRHQKGKARVVVIAARAAFTPYMVGQPMTDGPFFRQVFFTDKDTAQHLKGRKSTIAKKYPNSFVDPVTEVMTGYQTSQAVRASIADPFYINPALMEGRYYFTGAIDLFPLETAKALGDEVIAIYPSTNYTAYEDLMIQSTFGFSQYQNAVNATQIKGVKWVLLDGRAENFDPKPFLFNIVNKVPSTHENYVKGVRNQFNAGFDGGANALEN